MTPSSTPVLRARDLQVRLHRNGLVNTALRGVDLTIHRGEIVALVGESGSGKSTLGLAAQGLLDAESSPVVTGSLQVDGVEVVGASPAVMRSLRREHVGGVFQDPMTSLNPTMRIGRQLGEMVTTGSGDIVDDSVLGWLDRVGIPDPQQRQRAFPHQLSGGQRQRVMIALAMMRQPSLVVADEPTTALDVSVQAQVLALFRSLRDQNGTAFLFVTHDLSVASAVADRIVVLYAGRIVEQGAVRAVTGAPGHPYSAALLESRFGLDVDKGHTLATLPGEPPAPNSDPDGCSFAPRCLLAAEDCRTTLPLLRPVPQHDGAAACLHAESVTPTLWERAAQAWPAPPPTAGSGAVALVRNVTMAYAARRGSAGTVLALNGVELEIADRESVALVGESGSGKSTLLRLLAGLIQPSTGTVQVHTRDRPQMVYQDASASLTPWLSVGELVGERLRRSRTSRTRGARAERASAVREALRRVGLPAELERVRPAQLSGGQRQRVAVARAIVVPPQLLLCDEPVSAMDVSLAAGILNLLESLRRELSMTVVFVTHDIAAARFIADRIVVMRSGEIVEQGTAEQVVRAPRHDYTRMLLASMPVNSLAG